MPTRFPDGFLWGASTSSHQVEGGNVNNDWWALEQRKGWDPSGDANDSYHRYEEDLDLLAGANLTAYRFSLEWSRIEPERGTFSQAALAHYRRVLEACQKRNVTPVVTLNHFTVPRWFDERGGWLAADGTDLFNRFVENTLPLIGDGVEWVCTINEPNLMACLAPVLRGERKPAFFPPPPDQDLSAALLRAHQGAAERVRSVPGAKAGFTVAAMDFQETAETDDQARLLAQHVEKDWFEAARGDDFVGVQAYSRIRLGAGAPLSPEPGTETTLMGWEYYPAALGNSVRLAYELSWGTPILVTENGIATVDDQRRVDYTKEALQGLVAAIADGVDVRGYLHWSLLDNFEWNSGYRPTFGLVAVDRDTFKRTPKPSLAWLGDVAARNGRSVRT